MDRLGLKTASKQCILDAQSKPATTTFLYLLLTYFLNLLVTFAGRGTILDYTYLTTLIESENLPHILAAMSSSRLALAQGVGILVQLVLAVLSAGYTLYALRLSRGISKGFSDITEALAYTGKIVWLSILIGFFTFLWSLLFFIPGIVAAYRYHMAYFALMNDPSLTARQALNVSKRITYGHKMDIFVLDLSFIGWHILCGLTFGILYIWKAPYIQATYAHCFNWLMSLQEGPGGEAPNNPYDPDDPGSDGYQGPEVL